MVPLLLSPKNVIVKRIGGQEITGSQLLKYFKVYVKVLSSESHLVNKEFKEFKASNKKKESGLNNFFSKLWNNNLFEFSFHVSTNALALANEARLLIVTLPPSIAWACKVLMGLINSIQIINHTWKLQKVFKLFHEILYDKVFIGDD